MRHITNTLSGHHGTRDAEAAVFWVFAAIIMLIAFGDALGVLVGVVAVLAAISWIYRQVEHRVETRHTAMAHVTHLRPDFTGQTTSAHLGPRAA